MNKSVIAIMSIVLIVTACSNTRFTMHDNAFTPTHVAILKNVSAVERTATNAVRLKGQSKVGLRATRFTEHLFSTEIIRSTGDPMTIQIRTTPYDDSLLAMPGITLIVASDSTTLINQQDTSTHYTPLPIGKPFLLEIKHDGALFDLQIGHTHLGLQHTTLPNTEWVLIGLPRSGSVLVGDPRFIFGY